MVIFIIANIYLESNYFKFPWGKYNNNLNPI